VSRGSNLLVAGIVAAFKSGLYAGSPLSALLQRRSPPSWHFDPLSALLGAMAVFFVVALIYRYRAGLRARWQAIRAGVDRVRARLTSSLEDRYRAQVATAADAMHLLARFAPLTALYVPPPLIAPPISPARLLTEEEGPTGEAARDRRRLQALRAEPRTLDLSSALQYPRLAILGPLGAGKTALLTYLVITLARRQAKDNFGLDEDRLPLLLSLPDLNLETKEDGRARKKKRRDHEIRPIAGLVASQYRGLGSRAIVGLVRQRLRNGGCCLLFDGLDEMADEVRQRAESWLSELAQAYPDNRFVVVATPRSHDRLAAAGFVCFTLGEFTVTEARDFARRWQTTLAETNPTDGDVTDGGAALLPSPWLPRRGSISPLDLALRAAAWAEHGVVPTSRTALLAQTLDYALDQMDDNSLTPDQWRAVLGPLALTMHQEGRYTATREEIEALIRPLFLEEEGDTVEQESSQPTEADEENKPDGSEAEAEAAEAQGDDPLEEEEDEQPPDQQADEQEAAEQEIDEKERKRREQELARQKKLEEQEQRKREKEEEKQRKREEQQRAAREREATKHARKALASLLKGATLLVERDRDHLAFTSPALPTYLAAWQLAQTGETAANDPQSATLEDGISPLSAHVHDPRWQEVLTLYAALAPVTPLVVAQMQDKDDLFRSDLLAVAEYISLAAQSAGPPHRSLRDGILSELGKALMRPGQPLALRRAVAQALVHTGNQGVPLLFHQALTNTDPYLRAVVAWGLGEWADEKDEKAVPALIRALTDPEWLVRAAALHALATIGGEAATDGLVDGLQHEDEFTRRVAAEALVRLGPAGHSLLKEAVELTDMHIRRAAVYGLGLVDEDWVFPLLDDLRLNDPEWFVRSAVEEVIAAWERAAQPGDLSPRPLREVSWLTRWAAERGLSVSSDAAANQVLLQALAQGDWPVRLAAADTLRAQGGLWAVDALRQTLTDKDDLVRETTFAALKEISRRNGPPISP
jgi:HEAT repeat protein